MYRMWPEGWVRQFKPTSRLQPGVCPTPTRITIRTVYQPNDNGLSIVQSKSDIMADKSLSWSCFNRDFCLAVRPRAFCISALTAGDFSRSSRWLVGQTMRTRCCRATRRAVQWQPQSQGCWESAASASPLAKLPLPLLCMSVSVSAITALGGLTEQGEAQEEF